MWVATLWGLVLPVAAFWLGRIKPRRDLFFLMSYGQIWLYVHFVPLFTAGEVNLATQQRYVQFEGWAVLLLDAVFLGSYLWIVERKVPVETRRFTLSAPLTNLLAAGSLLLGLGYVFVATSEGLLFRRIGVAVAEPQINLPLWKFAVYRLFMEVGPFLMAFQLALLRVVPNAEPRSRRILMVALVGTTGFYLSYALLNSRLSAVLAMALLYGIFQVTAPDQGRLRPRTVVTALLALLVAGYMVRVVQNVREGFGTGVSIVDPQNLNPFPSRAGNLNPDESIRWRLNGLDLMAIIADNVEAQGPAWGTAWAVPFVISLDPIVRSALTTEFKRAGLTSAKSFLLLQYGGWAKTDYYSCMLSDAYGNFGLAGFVVVALALAAVFGYVARALDYASSPGTLVVALFFLTFALPFEQEFAHLLFGWFKIAPGLLLLLLLNPLRRPAGAMAPALAGPAPAL